MSFSNFLGILAQSSVNFMNGSFGRPNKPVDIVDSRVLTSQAGAFDEVLGHGHESRRIKFATAIRTNG